MCVSTGGAPAMRVSNATVSAWACASSFIAGGSREQLATGPAATFRALEDGPVVQPVWHILPELEPVRQHAIAGPVWRTRDRLAGILLVEMLQAAFQFSPLGQR